MSLEAALEHARRHRARFVESLSEWLAIPSISTDPARRPDMARAADWIAAKLDVLGFAGARRLGPESHPVVYAERPPPPGAPTVLVYGHYDVQPADPVELWTGDPFRPEIRDDCLYARGATDMKGQVMATVYALESLLAAGGLAVGVKVLIEGEEEIGSPHLAGVLEEHRELFAADVCLNPDCGMLPDQPIVTYGVRGCAFFELRLRGPARDLHSGVFGGAVDNPARVLCQLVAGMHDRDGRVTLPGFYDRVRELDDDERAELSRAPLGDDFLLRETGVPALRGETGYTSIERLGARPTLEVNGLVSGFTGEGSKTIIPAEAMVKLSARLVPDQDPAAVRGQLEAYLEANAPPTVRWELDQQGAAPAAISDRRSPWIRAMSTAQEEAWSRPSLLFRGGGSVPVIAHLQEILGIESVNVGFARPDDNPHAPDEKLHLPTVEKGVECLIRFFHAAGDLRGG